MLAGKIDRIEASFQDSIDVTKLKARAKQLGYSCSTQRLGDSRAMVITRTDSPNKAIFILKYSDLNISRKVLLNPSKNFTCYKQMETFMLNLIGGQAYFQGLILRRMDLAVDRNFTFERARKNVFIPYKQYGESFATRGGRFTGMYVGKKPKVFSIYSKSQEKKYYDQNEIRFPITRFEVKLSGKEKILDRIADLPELAERIVQENIQVFEHVNLLEVKFREDTCPLKNRKDYEKQLLLKHFHEAIGWNLTVRRLNFNGHFKRDYGHLYSAEFVDLELNLHLLTSLESFLNDEKNDLDYIMEGNSTVFYEEEEDELMS